MKEMSACDRWHKFQLRNKRLQRQLKSYGMSGLVAYGLTNTIYYTFAFLFVWLYIVKVPRGAAQLLIAVFSPVA